MDELSKKLAKYPKHIQEELPKIFPKDFVQHPSFLTFLEYEEYVYDLFTRGRDFHILATALVDVFSVKIYNHIITDGTAYEIYGSIQLTDGEGALFTLYNRNGDMPETICNGDPLTLTLDPSKGRAITPSDVITLKIDLKARIGGKVVDIVNDCHIWDYNMINDFDKVRTHKVKGVQGSAAVEYVIYRHAVFTTIDVLLVKENDKNESCKSANIYGNINVVYGHNYSATFFDKKQNESVVVEYGTYIELSRHVVVVPAYCSSITIRANLWNVDTNQKIVDKSKEYVVSHCIRSDMRAFEGIWVDIKWSHAYMQPKVEEASIGKNMDIMLSKAKKIQVISDRQSLPALFSNSEPIEVMEVFSVSICSNSDKELNLWGSIRVYDGTKQKFALFNKDKNSPERLVPNQTLPITFPPECIAYDEFGLILDLEDVDGTVISMGDVEWCDRSFELRISWFKRLLCSVVKGDDGFYAVIHYSIFSHAVQARVNIYLIDKTSSMKDTKVAGCVRAQYDNYKYVTLYDKEFYRRKLFTRQMEECSLEFVNSRINLSESVVAVPKRFALIVDVNLKVISHTYEMMQVTENFEKQLEFKPNMGNKVEMIKQTGHYIVVSVEWSNVVPSNLRS